MNTLQPTTDKSSVQETELKYFDFGDIPLKEANEMNIPVRCFLHEPDGDKYWSWTAQCYQPRREIISGDFEIRAETKEDILQAIRKYVVPLYEVATSNLKNKGENYYWEETL